MIKQFLQRWLGIQELSDNLVLHQRKHTLAKLGLRELNKAERREVDEAIKNGIEFEQTEPDRSSSPVATAPLPSQSDAEIIEAVKQAFDRAKDEIVVEILAKSPSLTDVDLSDGLNEIVGAEIVDKGIAGTPVYPVDDPHPPKVVKGYEQSGE